MTRTLNRDGQLALMMCAGTGYSAGQNFRPLRYKAAKLGNIFIIDRVDFINTKTANLFTGLASAGAAVTVLSIVSVISVGHGRKPPFLIKFLVVEILERQVVVRRNFFKVACIAA
jgi:predicted mannosyl-3-phosphoglycerate phosphatase (HAD superfamily)